MRIVVGFLDVVQAPWRRHALAARTRWLAVLNSRPTMVSTPRATSRWRRTPQGTEQQAVVAARWPAALFIEAQVGQRVPSVTWLPGQAASAHSVGRQEVGLNSSTDAAFVR
ncbi:hypothetical protein ACU686_15585 [Yinghuangia aomiensis]